MDTAVKVALIVIGSLVAIWVACNVLIVEAFYWRYRKNGRR